MTANTERRPSLRKADVPDELVSGITRRQPAAAPDVGERAEVQETPSRPVPEAQAAPLAVRRGPGRPRSRRRMEPFSSKIEIELRDQIDAYTVEHDESIVDLLDRALRAAIAQPPPRN